MIISFKINRNQDLDASHARCSIVIVFYYRYWLTYIFVIAVFVWFINIPI